MSFMQNCVLGLFTLLARFADTFADWAHTQKLSLQRKIDQCPDLTEEEIKRFTQSKEEFFNAPNEASAKIQEADAVYKKSAEIYFLMKQATALYEAENKVLPVQVFNEMRNALDHFMRSLICAPGDGKRADHLNRLEGHVQRAYLDVSKLLCGHYDKNVNDRHAAFPVESIGRVNDGEYIKDSTRLQAIAHSKFTEAKYRDYKLGDDRGNDNVRAAYIDAVIAHKVMHEHQLDNYHKLQWNHVKNKMLKGVSFWVTVLSGLLAGIILEAVWGLKDHLLRLLGIAS